MHHNNEHSRCIQKLSCRGVCNRHHIQALRRIYISLLISQSHASIPYHDLLRCEIFASGSVLAFGLARPCAGAMSFLDASNPAQTSALLAGLQAKTTCSSFWNSCAASLYTLAPAQSSSGLPAHASQSAPFRSVTANSSVHGLADSMRTRPLTRASRANQLKAIAPQCLYQAKEPEQIADVLRRAGKKALGGGIPGRLRSDLASPHCYWLSSRRACL